MKKVLIISYYFPPSGGPGVQRVLKFVKYLPQFGWEPIVLTVKDGDFPARDESLLKEIPPHIKVFRTDIFEPYQLYRRLLGKEKKGAIDVDNINKENKKDIREKLAEFIRATFFIPDGRKGWLKYAVKEGRKILENEKPDMIFSSSPPYTCALIAMKLKAFAKKKLNIEIPWVSDFRDAWTGYLTTPNRWFLPAILDRHYEKSTLEQADVLTTVASGIKDDFLCKYPEISMNKNFALIRNGFDSGDYFNKNITLKKNNVLTIVYTGSMYGKRNPYFFIDTIVKLYNEKKIEKDKIKLIFVGRCGSQILEYINNSIIKDSIELIPYVPHLESINYLLKADVKLLIIDEDKYSKMIISGKLFEYLGASLLNEKPIIAIAPEGEAADIIRETNTGYVIPHNDTELLSETILKLYNSIFVGVPPEESYESTDSIGIKSEQMSVNKEAIKKFDRKLLTETLAKTFNKILIN